MTRHHVLRASLGALALAALACAGRTTPAWELPPPRARDAAVVDPSRLTRTSLENGLELIVLEDPRLPHFEVGVVARRGSASEPLEKVGLAAFTAELMQRGAGERNALELAAVVDDLGARLSVYHDWDSMTASVSGLARDLDALFDVLVDVVQRPRFEADEAERVRSEQLASLVHAKDDPGTLARWHFARALYEGHRQGLPIEGTEETVRALTAQDARAFHAGLFVPQNLILYAVGDVTAQEIETRARRAFKGLRATDPLPPGRALPAPTPAQRRVVLVDRPDLGQAHIAIGHEGIARRDERRVAALLLNTVLGQGGFSSRLMGKVRAEEGLTYGIGSSFAQRREGGPFAVSTSTRAQEARRVVDLVIEELERMRRDPPSVEELANAQSQRAGSFALALETSSAVASALVDLSVQGLPEESLDTFRARVRAVTREQTGALARELLHPERVAIVIVGPAEVLAPQLTGLAPIERVAP